MYSGLLFEAAVLTASLALGGAGEVFSVHAYTSIPTHSVASGQLTERVSDRPSDGQAAPLWLNVPAELGTTAGIDSLRRVTGSNLLVGLSRLASADLAAFATEYPAQIDALLAAPPGATAVTGWWNGMEAGSRSDLAAAVPRLVGNLNGIPFRERSRANWRYLGETVAQVKLELERAPRGSDRGQLTRELAVLTQIKAALSASDGGPARSLVLLDPERGGRAAIALGHPDTADFVSYLVPGMNYGVQEQLVNWSATADALYAEQTAVLRAHRLGTVDPRSSVATIAWIGYETPDLFSVCGLDRAEAGADFLEESWLGIRSLRKADQPFISVFGHSYGTTVALVALARGSTEVDAFVMVGSPGSVVQSVDDLRVANDNVYVGEAAWDPAVNSAFFGSDPGARSYGAHALGVSGARDRTTGLWLDGSIGHNAYFAPGSESLHNMALIGTDHAELTTNGSE